jgi:hypothetical protein
MAIMLKWPLEGFFFHLPTRYHILLPLISAMLSRFRNQSIKKKLLNRPPRPHNREFEGVARWSSRCCWQACHDRQSQRQKQHCLASACQGGILIGDLYLSYKINQPGQQESNINSCPRWYTNKRPICCGDHYRFWTLSGIHRVCTM